MCIKHETNWNKKWTPLEKCRACRSKQQMGLQSFLMSVSATQTTQWKTTLDFKSRKTYKSAWLRRSMAQFMSVSKHSYPHGLVMARLNSYHQHLTLTTHTSATHIKGCESSYARSSPCMTRMSAVIVTIFSRMLAHFDQSPIYCFSKWTLVLDTVPCLVWKTCTNF